MYSWDILLNEERRRPMDDNLYPNDFRNGFERDYDRIVSFSSLRRLQDKTQIYPLEKNDFVRTRLTHSLQVSGIAKSLGYHICKLMEEDKNITLSRDNSEKIPSLLAAAGLVHDLGNPPFGHYGEYVIQNWFSKWFESEEYCSLEREGEGLTAEEKNDFTRFDGNPQTVRILAHLQFLNDHYGANLTYATLASLIKYPYSSSANKKKFGYFQSEENLYNQIQDKVGLKIGARHPLAFILEAADDISNAVGDLEESVKKGVVPWNEIYKQIRSTVGEQYKDMFNKLDALLEEATNNEVPDLQIIHVQNFRSWAKAIMFNAAADAFMENYNDIMSGEFHEDLMSKSSASNLHESISKVIKEYVHVAPEVLTLELTGNSVLSGLLDLFVPGIVFDEHDYSHRYTGGKLFKILSPNFRYVARFNEDGSVKPGSEKSLYNKLQLVTDYVSGMTDSYALELFQKLSGHKI